MKRKISVMAVIALMCLSSMVIINEDFCVGADPGGGTVGLDYNFIYAVIENLSYIIHSDDAVHEGIYKGRNFGTPGEFSAMMYLNKTLDDITGNLNANIVVERIGNESYLNPLHMMKRVNNKMEVLGYGLSLRNATSGSPNSTIPNNESFPFTPYIKLNEETVSSGGYVEVHWPPIGYEGNPPEGEKLNYSFFGLNITKYNISFTLLNASNTVISGNITYIDNYSNASYEEKAGNIHLTNASDNEYIDTVDMLGGCNASGFILMRDNVSNIKNWPINVSGVAVSAENGSILKNLIQNGTLFAFCPEGTNLSDGIGYLEIFHCEYNYSCCTKKIYLVNSSWWENNYMTLWEFSNNIGKRRCAGFLISDRAHPKTHFQYPTASVYGLRNVQTSFSRWNLPLIAINGSIIVDGEMKDVWDWVEENNGTNHPVTANFWIDQRKNFSVKSYNIYCDVQGENQNEWKYMSGGHYEAWWGQLTIDNAVGIGQMMGILKYLNDNQITPKCNLRFIFHGGHENTVKGSTSHVYNKSNRDVLKKANLIINLDQLGHHFQPATFRINTSKLLWIPIVNTIIDRSDYNEKYEDKHYRYKIGWMHQKGNGTVDCEPYTKFGDSHFYNLIPGINLNYINFCKDSHQMYHRTGFNHTLGETMDVLDWDDVNATVDNIWNVSKFFMVNPNCWLDGNPTYELWDSDDDNNYYDSINVSFSIDTSMPKEHVSVRLILFPKFTDNHPCFPIRYRHRAREEYTVTPDGVSGFINVSLPENFPVGEYVAQFYLCNSTGDIILDIVDQEIVITGLELIDYFRSTIGIDILEKFPNLDEFFEETRLNIIDWLKRLHDIRKVRKFLIDTLGCYVFSNDQSKHTGFIMGPPNDPPDKPNTPTGETNVIKLLPYKYTTSTTDPDSEDKIRFQWDWDYYPYSIWSIRKYNDNEEHQKWHSWFSSGNKAVRVRAKNPLNPNVYSEWSDAITVTAASQGCSYNIFQSQNSQYNPYTQNSANQNVVVVNKVTTYQGCSYGMGESPSYNYDFSGLSSASTQNTNYTFNKTGVYYVNLTVDSGGENISYNVTIDVVNISASFVMNRLGIQPNQTICFNDTSLSNRTIVNWTWNLGDGDISYEQNVSHNYTTIGAYNVTLTVKDVNSEEATFWQIVPIETDPPEIIDASYYPIPGTLGCNMTICAELFDDNGSGINTVNVNISYPNGTANNYTMEEDENNSYGYKYVFNDTMQVGWYFFDIWVSDYANNTNNFAGCGFEIQPAFGYSTIGNQSKNIDDNISGSNFTVLANGTAESISAYIHANLSTPPKTKCMIYRVNDSTLIGTTEEKTVNTGDEPDWVTFNFTTSKPNLTTNTQYILAYWSNDTCNLSYHNASDDSHGKYLSQAYGTPPNSIVNGTNESRIYSIFCNYSTIPFIKSSSASPDPIGFGYTTTINAEVEHYFTLVENITVNITYPNSIYVNSSMNQIDDDTFQYTTNTLWRVGQYNYTIWVKDKLGGNSTKTGYSFNVSAQASLTVSTIKDSYGDNQMLNLTDPPGEPPLISYEFLDGGDILHIWNKYDSYYFDTDSGIQLTNHYNEYWSHNVLMLGYYNNDKWNLMYRTDELSGFNKDIDTDNETYVNVTLWKNLEYMGYDFRLAIRYYLGVDDNELTVIPYIKNIDQSDIPYVLGFGWEMKDIQIDMTTSDDYINVNGTMYYLNQSLDNTYTDLSEPEFYLMENISETHTKSLYLKWNQSLTYKLQVKSRDGQYNAPVTLFVKIGTLASGQEKYTKLYWYDADQVIYYFDGYDNSEVWTISPWYMVDGSNSNYALTTSDGDIELCDDNNCSGSDIGEITTVEIRAHAYYAGDSRIVLLRPVFGGTTDGLNYPYSPTPSPGACSSWLEITRDPFAPGTWTWTDVVNLDCDVEVENDPYGDPFTMYCSKVDIRVTYNPYNPPGISNPYPANGGMGVPLTPMLNITVSDSDNDLMNITWLSNSSGSWQVFGTNNSVNNGVYHQMFTNATENGKWWYWKVNVTDGYNYTISSVYKFYTGYQSKINNTGSCHFKGYLLMQVHYYNETSEEWEVTDDTVNEFTPRVIPWADPGGTPGQNILALDTIFNGLVNTSNLSEYGNGTYRIYAALRDPDGDVLICDDETELEATYEFTITFE